MLALKIVSGQNKPFWNIVDNFNNMVLEGIRGKVKVKRLMSEAKICPNCCNYTFDGWICQECGDEIPAAV